MPNTEVTRVVSTISVKPPTEIFETLETLAASSAIERSIAKAASHGLGSNLSLFTTEQLIKIAHFYINADSTASTLFSQLIEEYRIRLGVMSQDEVLSLFTLCDSLDDIKARRPPNQIIVLFLEDLQAVLFEQLRTDRGLFIRVSSDPIQSTTLLEMLIRLGVSGKKLLVCQRLFAEAKPQLLSHYDADENLAFHAYIFYCRLLSKKSMMCKRSFYQEPFYRSTAAKVQWAAKQFQLTQLCALVKSCADAHIRDTSLCRTVARAVTAFENREVTGNIQALIQLLDSYAKLNIHDSRIFDLVFEQIVTNNMRPTTGDELTALHATALFGATGASKARVSRMVASLSPHVVTPTNSADLLKLELIRLFCRALFPKLPPLITPIENVQQGLGVISKVQQRVSNFLTDHGIENQCEAQIECYPYPVDIVIPSYRVIIEVDGPHHYDISGSVFLGKDCLKNALISQYWRLIRIDARKVNPTNLGILLDSIMHGPNPA